MLINKIQLNMRHIYVFSILISIAVLISIPIFGLAQSHHSDFQDGKLYIKYKDTQQISYSVLNNKQVEISTLPFVNELADSYSISKVSRPFDLNNDHKLLRTLMIEFNNNDRIDELIFELRKDPSVEYVEKVPLDKIAYTPNDSLFLLYNGPQNWNWHLELINAEQAWDVTKGNSEIVVAIVDNAVWIDHPDLSSKIVAKRDVYYNDEDPSPPSTGDAGDWSHGTHVAGLIGASTDNFVGISSIGFNVSLMAIRASSNSAPRSISVGYQGIQWAAQNGANVINMSWGSNQFSQTNQNLINSIASQGILLVAAAGNDNNSILHYPSSFQNVLSVASIDWDDVKSNFSNFSSTVDVSSPGGFASPGPSGLLSTTFSIGNFGYYDSFYGTSMASPVAAGLAGLILSMNPDLTPLQVEEIMKSSSDDISGQNPDYIGLLGAGRINAYRAVTSTPYAPTAAFHTPVQEIIPGTYIDFTDLSTGIPSEWEWIFEGATPSTVTDTNPQQIYYPVEGTFDVTLTVTNEWGTSTVTINDYIHVVTSPSPYIFISISDSLPCIVETVTLSDSSLYGPTSWSWSLEPLTFEFVNGTSSDSQNPQVVFLRQGYYDVIVSVSNQNGMTNKRFENAIHVKGVAPPYELNMEDGTSEYFVLWDTIKSQSAVDLRAANNSLYGIHFHGDPIPVGWKGGPENGTPQQVWVDNRAFHSEAHVCGVDARGLTNVKLAFDLRQTYSLGSKYSWFRVLVNGTPIADFNGNIDFNPTTASNDPWQRIEYDLSEFTGQIFDITLQGSNRFSDKVQGEGDNVFIDNLQILNSVPTKDISSAEDGLTIYPNPAKESFFIRIEGVANNSIVVISDIQGRKIKSFNTSNNSVMELNVSDFNPGIYIVSLISDNLMLSRKLIVEEKK